MSYFLNKRFCIGIFVSLILVIAVGISLICYNKSKVSAPSPIISIGIVNLTVIRNEGLAFKSFKEHIEGQYKLFHSQILDEETELRNSYEKIKKLEATPKKNTADLEKKRKEIDNKVLLLEKTIREKKDKLNSSFTTIRNEIENTIHEIVIEVAKKYNLNLVFNATILDAPVVLYGGQELDITHDILEELDKRLPVVHADPVTVLK